LHNLCFYVSISSIQMCDSYIWFMLQCWWWISKCHLLFSKWTLLEGLSTWLFIPRRKYLENPSTYLLLQLQLLEVNWDLSSVFSVIIYCESYFVFEVSFMVSFETKAVKLLASPAVQIPVTSSMHNLHFIFPNHWFCMSTDFTSIICIFKLTTDVPSLQKGLWCLGWQNSGTQSGDSKNMTLLGGILLKSLLISQ
jgi:hypothetical protein